MADICVDLEFPGDCHDGGKEQAVAAREEACGTRAFLKGSCPCRRASAREKGEEQPRRSKCRSLVLIGLGITMAVSIAVAIAALYMRAEEGEDEAELPSSCATGVNATTTCEFYEQLGSAIGGMDPLNECCHGCDELEGCQAWIFDAATTRCRWIKFVEEPCAQSPESASCRCMTHPGAMFGFKPRHPIVRVHGR
jgi:hypothetical protein